MAKTVPMHFDGMLFQEAVGMSIANFKSIFWPVAAEFVPQYYQNGIFQSVCFYNDIT